MFWVVTFTFSYLNWFPFLNMLDQRNSLWNFIFGILFLNFKLEESRLSHRLYSRLVRPVTQNTHCSIWSFSRKYKRFIALLNPKFFDKLVLYYIHFGESSLLFYMVMLIGIKKKLIELKISPFSLTSETKRWGCWDGVAHIKMAEHEKQPKICHARPSFSAYPSSKLLKSFHNAMLIDSNEIHNTSRDEGKYGLLVIDSFTFHCFNLVF